MGRVGCSVLYNPMSHGDHTPIVQRCTIHESWGPCIVVQPHDSWGFIPVVQRCMAHDPWRFVTMYRSITHGEKVAEGALFIGSDNGFQDVKIVYALLVFAPAAFFVPPPAFLVVLLTLTGTAVPSSPFLLDDFFLAAVGLPADSSSLLGAA